MNDSELRQLCNQFLDAVERHDLDGVAATCAPEFTIWVNVAGAERTREENLQTLAEGRPGHRRRTLDDRTINTFATGFVVQHSVNIVEHDGGCRSLWACLVALCKNGQITRIDEYQDSSKFTDASSLAAPK